MKGRTRLSAGFTLIELVIVIVILGVLASVAAPKFANMTDKAGVAAAQGTFSAAQSAANVNFSKGLLGLAGYAAITDGQTLIDTMNTDGTWVASGAAISKTINGTTYTITVSTAETLTGNNAGPAQLTKSF